MELPLINSILRELSGPVVIPHVSIPSVKILHVIGFVVAMLFGRSFISLLLRIPEAVVDFIDSCFRAFYGVVDALVGLVTPSYAFRTTSNASFSSRHTEKTHASWGDTFDYRQQHDSQRTSGDESEGAASLHPSPLCTAACFDLLGLSPSATPKEAKSAYRNLIKKTHPDLFVRASPERQRRASVTSVKLREAYEAIIAAHGPEL